MIHSNAPAKKLVIERHRAAFDLWGMLQRSLETVVILDRRNEIPFARALDLLFIQAFKSHSSLYPLCVLGLCEDAATIARRILEITLQIGYLDSEPAEQENRGLQYIAYFWHLAQGILADASLPVEQRQRWQELYDQNKRWLKFNSKDKPLKNWSGLSFADLAAKLKLQSTYEVDYRFLSNAAHASSAGAMYQILNGVLQITDDTFVTPILVYGARYMLAVTEIWNAHFKLIDDATMVEMRNRVLGFDFRAAKEVLKNIQAGDAQAKAASDH